MFKFLSKLVSKPVGRHLLAGLGIILLLWVFSIRPLQKENESFRTELSVINVRQYDLIKELSDKETYKIENRVSDVKMKKGGVIKMIPDNDMDITPETKKHSQDSVKPNNKKAVKKKRWWKFWTSTNTRHRFYNHSNTHLKHINQTSIRHLVKKTHLGFVWHRDFHFSLPQWNYSDNTYLINNTKHYG